MRYIKIIQAVLFITLLTGVAAACSDDTPAGEDNSTEQGGNGATDKDNPDNNGNSDTDNSDSSEYPTPDRSAIAAFPGAEGAGKYTTGGAGGTVYVVTSLEDSNAPGTLRHAVEQSGKRTVVFAVGGVIKLNKQLVIRNDDITIAGQTAPGAGICLKDYTLRVNANNVIIRFIRCRMGDEAQTEDDAMNGYQKEYPGKRNIIIDHCSMSWSTDECASFYGNTNFTMQWCIVSESLWHSVHDKGNHGYGGLWGGTPATFHHNLVAHHSNRTPRLCGSRYSNRADMEKVDLCNNVIYNWTSEGAYGGQGGSYNILNNYYKLGPASVANGTHARFFTAYVDKGSEEYPQAAGVYGHFYLSGNVIDNTRTELSSSQQAEVAAANADNTSSTAFVVKDERNAAEITTAVEASDLLAPVRFSTLPDYSFVESADAAYESVLTYAGSWICGWTANGYTIPKRDKIDMRIVNDTRMGIFSTTASKGGGNGLIDTQSDTPEKWDDYVATTSSLIDSDNDGMPDEWEKANGLDPNDNRDSGKYNLNSQYTNLEVYINGLVKTLYPF